MVEEQQKRNDRFEGIRSHIIQIELKDPSCFSKIAEVLTRIGIPSYKTHTLFQTAHILYKRQKYYIVHFKDMFVLDGKKSTITHADIDRVYTIVNLLQQWNLCEVVDNIDMTKYNVPLLIVPRTHIDQWKLVPKYNIGHCRSKQ